MDFVREYVNKLQVMSTQIMAKNVCYQNILCRKTGVEYFFAKIYCSRGLEVSKIYNIFERDVHILIVQPIHVHEYVTINIEVFLLCEMAHLIHFAITTEIIHHCHPSHRPENVIFR